MIPFTSLLLPIVVSAVAVFLVSSVLHMALPWHHGDWKRLPNEAELQDALRKANIPPGDYMLPCPSTPGGMREPAFKERMIAGPNATLTLRPGGLPNMGPYLAKWFGFLLVVGALCALNAWAAVESASQSHRIIHFVALPAFLAHGLAPWPDKIWYRRATGTAVRNTIDGLIYALVTAGVFVWLWPKG